METSRIAVLGAGNTGFAIAANLALAGHDVLLWEHPDFASALDPIRDTLTIHLDGAARIGAAKLAAVTTDPAVALDFADVLLGSVPSYAQAAFAALLTPYLRAGHLLALLPGNLGTFVFRKALRAAGTEAVMVAESDTAPYVCRKTGPDRATIFGVVSGLGVGVWPSGQTNTAMTALETLFPGARAYRNALQAGLSALNPVVHPPGVLMNAGRIERSRGEFWFYEEGVTDSVVRAIAALDGERRAIGAALGMTLSPVAAAFADAGFGPMSSDLWAVINGSRMLTALRAPGSVNTRWLTEDIPYGLATWAALGDALGVPTPLMDGLIALASAALGIDFAAEARGLDALGLAGLDAGGMLDVAMGDDAEAVGDMTPGT
ncbi:MAG: NAD/NADP octopine/nopaline dehydrogenase family protein [Thermomicrobiales bacterium]|nr:NAD/NADP octopine/nopaline dehydrogenase family protein [Thermomicrobiales bacterium]